MTSSLVDAARGYLTAGLEIIALTGKQPNTLFHPSGKDSALVGVPETPEDDALIEKLFTHPTTSGVGIVLGEHMVVVDIDGEEGAEAFGSIMGGLDGFLSLGAGTAVAQTGRGLHLYYLSPEVRHSTTLGTKLDVKAFGGYVAAPPSRHPDGAIYKWLDPLVDEDSGQRVALDWLPDAIEALLDATATLPDPEASREPSMTLKFEGTRWKITYDWSGLERTIYEAPDGTQNNIIHWAACVARDEGRTLDQAMMHLYPAALAGGHPAERARTAIRSAYKRKRA